MIASSFEVVEPSDPRRSMVAQISRRVRWYWDRNWQAKHIRLLNHQLTTSHVNRFRTTVQPHGVEMGVR